MTTPTASGTARNGDVEISYETFGPRDGEPLLLIMGVGGQRYGWPPGFCAALVERGFRVTRFDNRDTGTSTRFDTAGRPGDLLLWLRPSAAARYTLDDMAGDALAVLDDQRSDAAHLVGISMGGMIAQVLACSRPDRVRSLTSVSSGSSPRSGIPRPGTLLRLANIVRTPVTDLESMARQLTGIDAVLGSPAYPSDPEWLRELARQTFEHRGDAAAAQRHTAAIAASGDLRPRLASCRVPTLVLHGDADRMVRPVAGRQTAAAIQGARLVTFPGMGHDLPRALWPEITAEIGALAGEAARLG